MTRLALPPRRAQETFDLDHDGQRYAVSVGLYRDGQLGEVFIQAHRRGTQIEAAARDSAILISFMIQHGLLVDQLRHGLTRDGQGFPASIVGAVLDAISP